MIPLDIQIKSIMFSFIYGMFFSFFTYLAHGFIYNTKGIAKIIINVLFVLDNVVVYFILLRIINDDILHYYFILSLILGFVFVNKLTNKFLFKLSRGFFEFMMI